MECEVVAWNSQRGVNFCCIGSLAIVKIEIKLIVLSNYILIKAFTYGIVKILDQSLIGYMYVYATT